jgi:DNA-binding MarR family transcriptional regulator
MARRITYVQYLVLLVLWEGDGLSVREIGRRLALDSGTLTPLLRRLERSGLLTRRRAAGDERELQIRLTDAGKTARARNLPRAGPGRLQNGARTAGICVAAQGTPRARVAAESFLARLAGALVLGDLIAGRRFSEDYLKVAGCERVFEDSDSGALRSRQNSVALSH